MARHRSHSIEFKRRVAQEFIAGETLHGLAKRYDVSRTLIRVWVKKLEAGALDDDAQAADLLEIEFLKGAVRSAPRPRSATTSVIAGPMASPSPKDVV